MDEAIGPWALLEPLSSHGAFKTWRAQHAQTQAIAVLRALSASAAKQPGLRDAFFDDLQAARAVEHRGVAQVLDVGELPDGSLFFAAAWVEGPSLAQLLAAAPQVGQRPFAPALAVAVLEPVLRAVEALHQHQVLLRELSPESVRLTDSGQVVLTDVGFVRTRRLVKGASLRHSYVSPEQARGQAIDARSDVFVLGLLAFELLCGRLPAEGEGSEVLSRIALGELDAPEAANPKLPAPLAQVLRGALASTASARFASAAALREALLAALEGAPASEAQLQEVVALLRAAPAAAVPALVEPAAPPAPPPPRRLRWVAALAGGVALAALALVRSPAPPVILPTPSMALQPGAIVTKVESSPPGSEVTLDGVVQLERTPFTFTTVPAATHQVEVRRGLRTEKAVVHNTRTLWLDLDGSAAPRLEAYPPKQQSPAAPVAAPVAAPPPQEPKQAPPAVFTLTAEHQVSLAQTPAVVVPRPARLVRTDPMTRVLPPPGGRAFAVPNREAATVWAMELKDSQLVKPQPLSPGETLALSPAEYRVARFSRGAEASRDPLLLRLELVDTRRVTSLTLGGKRRPEGTGAQAALEAGEGAVVVAVPDAKSLKVANLEIGARYALAVRSVRSLTDLLEDSDPTCGGALPLPSKNRRAKARPKVLPPAPAVVMIAVTQAGDAVTVFQGQTEVTGASELRLAVPVSKPGVEVPQLSVELTKLSGP